MPDASESCPRALAAERQFVERILRRELRACRPIPERLRKAMAYSLFAGGKRLRPVLVLWTWDALAEDGRDHAEAVDRDTAARVAAAVEMIHTYSLIHDDLPAMDDDVLRRGRPTCHVAFDEGTAILAGDGLQAAAFGLLADCGPRAAKLVALTAAAAGPAGMVGGQQRDLEAEGKCLTASAVRGIHAGKTAAMLALCLTLGAHCRAADDILVERLAAAGRCLGLAFQGADDALDASAHSAVLGKTPGKDATQGKATWVRLEGLEASWARTRRIGRRGVRALSELLPPRPASERLLWLARQMYDRDR